MAQIKRIAQNMAPLEAKKNKILSQIEDLNNQLMEINSLLSDYDRAAYNMAGRSALDLVVKDQITVEDGGKKKVFYRFGPNLAVVTSNQDGTYSFLTESEMEASYKEVEQETENYNNTELF